MNVKCFECDALIESPSLDAIADAFVAHGQQIHNWSYPEVSVRNYAEVTGRLTGGLSACPRSATS